MRPARPWPVNPHQVSWVLATVHPVPCETICLPSFPPYTSASQQAAPGLNPEIGGGGPTQGNKGLCSTGGRPSPGTCVRQGIAHAPPRCFRCCELCPWRRAVYTPELPPVCSSESHANPPFSPLIKIPGLQPSSNFLSTCAVRPCLSCFFPILSTRGSPQVKNGNETWLLNLYPLLASNHGNAIHTLHRWLSQGGHAARCCSHSAGL